MGCWHPLLVTGHGLTLQTEAECLLIILIWIINIPNEQANGNGCKEKLSETI